MNPIYLAGEGEGFVPPSAEDFWQPLVGDGNFALTRPMVLMVIATVVVIVIGLVGTRRLQVVPGKGQWMFESVDRKSVV